MTAYIATYDMGDWLSWHTGISEPGFVAFLNFALPMEGLATWGLFGFLAYPLVIYFSLLYVCARISSFRLALPVSSMLFDSIAPMFVEHTSDGLLSLATRSIPTTIILVFILHKILSPGARPSQSRPAQAPV